MTPKFFLTTLILVLFSNQSLKSQSSCPEFTIKTGYGYFGDVSQYLNPGFGDVPPYIKVNPKVEGKIQHGKSVWFDVNYLLNSGFTIGIAINYGNTHTYYNDGLGVFWDKKQITTHQIADISFGKEVRLNKHSLMFSLGMIYRYSFTSFSDYDVLLGSNNQPFPGPLTVIEVPAHDLGMSFKIDYTYKIKNQMLVGLRMNPNLVFALGFESFALSPYIGARF
jgi:hypothetical protein